MQVGMDYELGKHVMFTDENQHEIAGNIVRRESLEDRLILRIALDWGGYYDATLMRRKPRPER